MARRRSPGEPTRESDELYKGDLCMKLIKDLSGNYSDCIVTYFNYEKHVQGYTDIEDTALCIGYNCLWNTQVHDYVAQFDKRLFFNGEQPCAFTQEKKMGLRSADIGDIFTDIYTICPYTARWANEKYNNGREKFKLTVFPIDEENVLKFNPEVKEYDAIFYGSICGKTHVDIVNAISGFKYTFITLGEEHWYPNAALDTNEVAQKITHINISTAQKWDILSKTKVVPIVNHLFLHDQHIQYIKSYDGWEDNEAFSHLEQRIAPQLKPRIVEAAFFKMLMLVKRDPWNAIEFFYEPEKEFLYYDDEEELPGLIEKISSNWNDYKHIVDNAYDKAMKNFTTEAVLRKMIEEGDK